MLGKAGQCEELLLSPLHLGLLLFKRHAFVPTPAKRQVYTREVPNPFFGIFCVTLTLFAGLEEQGGVCCCIVHVIERYVIGA